MFHYLYIFAIHTLYVFCGYSVNLDSNIQISITFSSMLYRKVYFLFEKLYKKIVLRIYQTAPFFKTILRHFHIRNLINKLMYYLRTWESNDSATVVKIKNPI